MILEIMKRKLIDCIKKYGPWVWLFLVTAVNIWYILFPGEKLLDSDLAAELILADQLNKEHSILSFDWFYSTELRIVNLQWFYRLGLLIFPHSWTYARAFGMLLFYIVYVVVIMFLGKQIFDQNKEMQVLFAVTLLSPFGVWYHFYGTYGGYYLLINLLSVLGLVLHIASVKAKNHGYIVLAICAGCLLAFINGIQSVRQIMCFYIPLFMATALILFTDIDKGLRKGDSNVRLFSILKEPVLKISLKSMCYSFILLITSVGETVRKLTA